MRIHATRNDRSCLDHALPFLFVVRSLSLVILKHVCDELVGSITFHLAKTHGSYMDTAGTNDAGDFGVHECRVSPLCLWACDCTVASTMVVQELPWEVAASHGNGSPSRNIAVNQESSVLAQGTKLRKHILSTSNHLCRVVCRDVSGEQLRLARLLDASTHGFDNFWDAFVHLAEDLVALGLVVFDEVSTLPECVACLTKGFRLQAQLRLNDRANHQSSILCSASKDAPHIHDAARGPVEQSQIGGREVNVIDFSILHITHTLIVSDSQGQNRTHHCTTVCDVPVKEHCGIGNFHLLLIRVDVVHKCVDRFCEVVRRAHIHIGTR